MGAFFDIDKLQQRIGQTDMSTDATVHGNKLALDYLTNTIWSGNDVDTQTGKKPPMKPQIPDGTFGASGMTTAVIPDPGSHQVATARSVTCKAFAPHVLLQSMTNDAGDILQTSLFPMDTMCDWHPVMVSTDRTYKGNDYSVAGHRQRRADPGRTEVG